MHICHVTTAHPTRDVRIFVKECVALAEAGHQVTLLVAGKGDSMVDKGVNIRIMPVRHKSRIGRMIRAPRRFARHVIALNPDVVHFHDPEFLLVAMKLKRRGFRMVYDVHEDVPRQILSKYWIPAWLRKIVANVVERYENRMARRMDAIIAATPFIAKRFEKLNPNTDFVRNYPIPAEFESTVPREKPYTPHLCYIGGITAIRGIREIVQAIEDCDIVLDLAGPVESCELFDELKKYPGWKRKIYHGTVSRQEVSRIMTSAMAGLVLFHPVPNHIDAMPTKLFEYMLAGIPVIASDFPLWKNIIETHNCGICVDPMNVFQIREAIQWMLDHPEEVGEMGKRAKELALKDYNWDTEKQRLIAVYARFGADHQKNTTSVSS